MSIFSRILDSLRKKRREELPPQEVHVAPSVASTLEIARLQEFTRRLKTLLLSDKYLARSDYKRLVEDYLDLNAFFQNQKDRADDVRYRASALIREFMVTDGDNDQVGVVDKHPTHLYEYLYTQSSIEDIHIQWKPVKFQDIKINPQPRINVCTYTFDGKTLTKNKGIADTKAWGFSR